MSDSFAKARVLRTPGVEISTTISSAVMTPRVRSATRKMIAGCTLTGGWSSKARMAAKLYFNVFKLPRVVSIYQDIETNPQAVKLDDARVERLLELIEADYTMTMMLPDNGSYRAPYAIDRAVYVRGEAQKAVALLKVGAGRATHFTINNDALHRQACEILGAWLMEPPEVAERVKAALAAFDAGDRIKIDLDNLPGDV